MKNYLCIKKGELPFDESKIEQLTTDSITALAEYYIAYTNSMLNVLSIDMIINSSDLTDNAKIVLIHENVKQAFNFQKLWLKYKEILCVLPY